MDTLLHLNRNAKLRTLLCFSISEDKRDSKPKRKEGMLPSNLKR